jgi:hypothetical protein
MTGEQRWTASGVVVVLSGLWAAVGVWTVSEPYRWDPPSDDGTGLYVFVVGLLILGLAVAWLVVGLLTVQRVASADWPWRPPALLSCLAAALSLLAAGAGWSMDDGVPSTLFGFQAVALVAYAALLRTSPRPVDSPTGADA